MLMQRDNRARGYIVLVCEGQRMDTMAQGIWINNGFG